MLNKIDLPSADPEVVKDQIIDLIGCEDKDIIPASAKTGLGIEKILEAIVERIPHPIGEKDAPLQAMIFDSVYNSFRGIEAYFKIVNGELKKGYLVKKNLATSNGGLIHTIYNDLGKDDAASYLNNCQGITNNFLLHTGFSVGISDLIIGKNIVNQLSTIIKEKKENVNNNLIDIQNGLLERKYHTSLNEEFETLVTQELNSASDDVGNLTVESLNVINNRFVNMVEAGSKGNIINICQMIGCVGQCAVDGRRIPKHCKNGTLYGRIQPGIRESGF